MVVADVYTTQIAPGVDGPFDVVHAHQVLQHVHDPVQVPALDEWLALYRRLARAADGEPDAGRRLRADLERIRAGWLEWASAEDGWFVVPHDEVVCRP